MEAEGLFDVLHGGGFREHFRVAAAFLTVERDQDARRFGAALLDDLDGFADRRARADDVVDDDDLALEGRADDDAAFTVVLGFLAVEGPGHVAAEAREVDGDGRGERNALVGGPEDHVEFDAALFLGGQEGLRVKLTETVQKGAGVEQAGVEEVRRKTPGLGFEFSEAENVGLKRKFDELLLNRHGKRSARTVFPQGPTERETIKIRLF